LNKAGMDIQESFWLSGKARGFDLKMPDIIPTWQSRSARSRHY
jgi:hypothetical protein